MKTNTAKHLNEISLCFNWIAQTGGHSYKLLSYLNYDSSTQTIETLPVRTMLASLNTIIDPLKRLATHILHKRIFVFTIAENKIMTFRKTLFTGFRCKLFFSPFSDFYRGLDRKTH